MGGQSARGPGGFDRSKPARGRLHDILLYGVSRGATELLLAFRGVLLASILGPAAFGGWVLFRLATQYAGFARLGLNAGLELHVAKASSAGHDEERVMFGRTALGFLLSVFGSISLVALVASVVVESASLTTGLRWFAGAILVEQLWVLGLAYLRSMGDLRHYALYEATNAALQVALALALAPVWGLQGAFGGFVLATALSLLILARKSPRTPSLSPSHLRAMLQVGLPVVASVILGFLLASADRLIVAEQGDLVLLGLYGFAFSTVGIAGSIAWVIRVVVYPELYAQVSKHGERSALAEHLAETVIPFAYLSPPIFGLGAIILGPVVALYLPHYIEAVPAARTLIFMGVTVGFERLGVLGMIASGRQKILPLVSIAALLMNVFLSITALRTGLGLQGVATAALVSNSTFGLVTLTLVAKVAELEKYRWTAIKLAWPMVWCFLSVEILGAIYRGLDVQSSVRLLAFYLVLISPLLPWWYAQFRRLRRRMTRPLLEPGQ